MAVIGAGGAGEIAGRAGGRAVCHPEDTRAKRGVRRIYFDDFELSIDSGLRSRSFTALRMTVAGLRMTAALAGPGAEARHR
jgi:hypothetical protein